MKRRAFTWVELLVVIAIIGVLLALMGVVFLVQVPFFIFFGWIWGLCRLVLGLLHEPMAVLLAVFGFVLLPLTFHLFAAPIAKRFERAWTFRKSFAASSMLVLVAAAGIALAAGFHDALWFFRPSEPIIDGGGRAVRRMQAWNQVKQIGIGTHDFHDAHYTLPSGATILEDGRLGHGWMTQLLPFCEYPALYEKIDLSKSWNDPVNEAAFKERVGAYQSPYLKAIEKEMSPEPHGFARTDFSANQFALPVGRALQFSNFTDGTSYTMLSGEIVQHLPAWGDPINGRDLRLGINRSEAGFGSKHTGGMNIGLCDGAVKFFADSTDPKILEALASPNGGEKVPTP